MSASDEDRRKTERKSLRTRATVILGQTQAFEVRTLDVSAGGMAIVAQANPPPGVVLGIRFMFPLKPSGYAPFEARARVVHSVFSSAESGFKVGLSFIDLPSDAAATIAKYLA